MSCIRFAGWSAYFELSQNFRYTRKLVKFHIQSYWSMAFAVISLGVAPMSNWRQSGVYCRCSSWQDMNMISVLPSCWKPSGSFHGVCESI